MTVLLGLVMGLILGFAFSCEGKLKQALMGGLIAGIFTGGVTGLCGGGLLLAICVFAASMVGSLIAAFLPDSNPVKRYFNLNSKVMTATSMKTIYAILDADGRRIFNVITEDVDTKVSVEGLPGATVVSEPFDQEVFDALPVQTFPGQIATLLIGEQPCGKVLNFRSVSKIELPSSVPALTIRFSDASDEGS